MKIFVDLDKKIENKIGFLEYAADLCLSKNLIKDRDLFFKALVAREKEITTGIGHGICFPHAAGSFVPFVYFARTITPIDFESIDKKPSDLFFIIGTPPEMAKTHLRVLSTLSKHLQNEDFKYLLRTSTSLDKIREKLLEIFKINVLVVTDDETLKYDLIQKYNEDINFTFVQGFQVVSSINTNNYHFKINNSSIDLLGYENIKLKSNIIDTLDDLTFHM